jgi:hypothetical protein
MEELALDLRARFGRDVLLAFPPAPFVLALAGDVRGFLSHASRHPDHRVHIRPDAEDATATGWVIQPADHEGPGYALRFSLPPYVEEWLRADWQRVRQLKQTSLSTIVIYQMREGVPHAHQLSYEPRPRNTWGSR